MPEMTLGSSGEPLALTRSDFSKLYNAKEGSEDWDVLEEQKWSAYHRLESFRRLVAWARGEGWRGMKNYIGTPILYPDFASESFDLVLNSAAVQRTIQELATRRASHIMSHIHQGKISPTIVQVMMKEPESPWDPSLAGIKLDLPKPLRDIIPKNKHYRGDDLQRFYTYVHTKLIDELNHGAAIIMEKSAARLNSGSFVQGFGFSVNEILVSMYNLGTHVKMEQVLELRRIAADAQEKRQSIVFLPCHKSHIDYLVMSFIMYRIGMALPHIIAGNNLDLPVLGGILRQGGALFVRRTFQGDSLYPSVIKEYIMTLLERGMNMEVFIEGTRSRTGKLLPPRYGILKYMMTALRENRTDDILLCPVSLQYDSVIEAETYVSELLGKPKEPESLYNIVRSSSSLLQLKMGRIDVRFKQPWSMRQWLDEEASARKLSVQTEQTDNQLLKALGYRILSDINSVSVIMPSALVGTVMLTLRGRGIGRAALIDGVTRLRERILNKGMEVANFGLDHIGDVVDRALKDMKGLIVEHKNLLEPTFEPVKKFELSFYRNQIMHIFVHESLVCVSLYTHVKHGGPESDQVMSYKELYEECAFISNVLRDEFVYGSLPLEQNIKNVVRTLVEEDVLAFLPTEGQSATVEDWVEGRALLHLAEAERFSGRRHFDLFLFLVWPYIECYWLAAVSLLALAPERPVGMDTKKVPWYQNKDLIPCAQKIGHTLFQQGMLSHDEAVNGASLANAFSYFEQRNILIKRKKGERKPVTLVTLNPEWIPSANPLGVQHVSDLPEEEYGRLAQFISQLGDFRREGKDRRSQSDWRVSAHIYAGGAKLVEWAPLEQARKLKL